MIAQATYLSPMATARDDLADTAKATAREIHSVSPLLSFIASKQSKTLGNLPEAVEHPASALLNSYVEEGILVHTGLPRSRRTLDTSISKGPHASA